MFLNRKVAIPLFLLLLIIGSTPFFERIETTQFSAYAACRKVAVATKSYAPWAHERITAKMFRSRIRFFDGFSTIDCRTVGIGPFWIVRTARHLWGTCEKQGENGESTVCPEDYFGVSLTNTLVPTPTAAGPGMVQPTSTSTDSISAPTTPEATPAAADLIFEDDFESGDLSAWTASSTNEDHLAVSSDASLSGKLGLQVTFANTTTMFVRDDTPDAEARYRARFYFHPNSIVMASGDNITLFQGLEPEGQVILAIQLSGESTGYQLRARAYDSGSADYVNIPPVDITDAVHYVEVDWGNDGHLTLWIDGVQQSSLTGINNNMYTMDRIRLGAPFLSLSGTSGSLYIDNFESRKQTYIGP